MRADVNSEVLEKLENSKTRCCASGQRAYVRSSFRSRGFRKTRENSENSGKTRGQYPERARLLLLRERPRLAGMPPPRPNAYRRSTGRRRCCASSCTRTSSTAKTATTSWARQCRGRQCPGRVPYREAQAVLRRARSGHARQAELGAAGQGGEPSPFEPLLGRAALPVSPPRAPPCTPPPR